MAEPTITVSQPDTVWTIIGDLAGGVLTQPVPGWIVLVILFATQLPRLTRFVLAWYGIDAQKDTRL